ncbi:MAG: hypothetical protein HQL49_07625 [Gammaproteobacteria bacterium]|nr:hypothetical protein [Gammaproteobacteria bacterium]
MNDALWRRQIFPFILLLGLLAIATIAGDYLLHRLDLAWVGRYLGIPGTLLILASLLYSLRKRKYIQMGTPQRLLTFHELATWFGSLMVLLHAGIHFNAILPWLATLAMGINVISGMVGKLLLKRSRAHLLKQRDHYQLRGLSAPEIEHEIFWSAVTLDAMSKWRKVHIPIAITFGVLALGHIISIFLFWSWQ